MNRRGGGLTERARLNFVAAVCEELRGAPVNKVIWFRCPVCGREACAVNLGPGDRRGACSCGKFLEKR